MLRQSVLIIALLLFIFQPGLANAQGDPDAQLVKAMNAMKSAWSECTSKKFLECVAVDKQGWRVTGNLARTINGSDERTEIKIGGNLTPADAQRAFNLDADSIRKPPTNNVPPIQFWRTETFAAVAGQSDSGVLTAWLAPNPDSANGSAFGVMVCGNLVVNWKMSFYAPAGISRGDKSLVDATQSQLKGLMQQLASTMTGACGGGKSKLLQLVPLGDVTPSVRNDADPFAVYPGDKVKVTGVVWAVEEFDGIFPKNPLNVQANVEISQGAASYVQKITTDAQGYYETEYILDDRVSFIVVQAQSPDPNRYETGQRLYALDLKKRGTLTVTAATDKAVYAPGESVTVSGNVLADGKPIAATIGFRSDILPLISINSPSGSFQYTFTPGQEPKRDLLGPFQNGLHIVTAQATVLGYDGGSAGATYLVEQAITCTSLSAQVVNLAGVAHVVPIDPKSLQMGGDAATAVAISSASVNTNTKLMQGLKVQTDAGARVALRFEGEEGASATVAVNDSTAVQIQTFCKDKATGRIQAVLVVDGPGQVVVNKTTSGSIFSNLDIAVLTRNVRVKSINTRYFVGVDSQGTTTIAALEGTVLISALDGANGIELPPLKRIAVQSGERPDASKTAVLDGRIDPALEVMVKQAPSLAPATGPSPLTATTTSNPIILLGVAGAVAALAAALVVGILVFRRSRARPVALNRPTDLPERGATRKPSKPTDLPR
ncbi:MAG: hypothetical protein HY782_19590 [Chloroflexi bacterium]|nr:hypothetical protein [Chloroflexota bacterium]